MYTHEYSCCQSPLAISPGASENDVVDTMDQSFFFCMLVILSITCVFQTVHGICVVQGNVQ